MTTRALPATDTHRLRRYLTAIVVALGASIAFLYILMPFYWMLKSSFQTDMEIIAIPPVWWPSNFSLRPYERALTIVPLVRYMANSLFVSGMTTTISTILACMAAYVIARHKFPGATIILLLFLFTQLIPSITRVFPAYFVLQKLKLINSYVGLIIAYVSFSLPYAVLMLQGYFATSYPHELEEAALLDGCTWFSAFTRIVLPISVPGIIAIGTYSFLGSWNDFLWASLLLNKGSMKTIQVGLRDFVGEFGVTNMNNFMAGCVMAAIPAVILFRLAQGSIAQGLAAGAIKG